MIAKPIFGRGGKNQFYINNKKDFLFFKRKKNFIVQNLVKGKEYTSDCLFNNKGKLIFSLTRERLVHRGVSIVGKVVREQNIKKMIILISKLLNFYGPINMQFIKDSFGKIWLIEINPRLSGSIEFSIKAGFNPLLYFREIKFKKPKIKYNSIFTRYLISSLK